MKEKGKSVNSASTLNSGKDNGSHQTQKLAIKFQDGCPILPNKEINIFVSVELI